MDFIFILAGLLVIYAAVSKTMAEISVEKNSTIIFPAQFTTTVQEAIALLSKDSASK